MTARRTLALADATELEPSHGLAALLRALSVDDDAAARFPYGSFALLHERGLLGDRRVVAGPSVLPLLRLLAEIGRGDLATGRIFEGHVNALLLVGRFGRPRQADEAYAQAAGGDLLGVWNTDRPGDPVRLDANGRLHGAKTFASGVDGLARALITAARADGGRQMLLVPLASRPVDRDWWRPMGMVASVSHVVSFEGLETDPDWWIGGPDDYLREPWFSAGAIRFAAVQAGGVHALLDVARGHLVSTGRADDPYQRHRLADLALHVETAHGWLERTARRFDDGCRIGMGAGASEAAVAHANLARTAIERAAMDAIAVASRAVGAAGMIRPHPLERLLRDLGTYLRQPNPDRALALAGAAVADGRLQPGA